MFERSVLKPPKPNAIVTSLLKSLFKTCRRTRNPLSSSLGTETAILETSESGSDDGARHFSEDMMSSLCLQRGGAIGRLSPISAYVAYSISYSTVDLTSERNARLTANLLRLIFRK